jgi:hypothetical protein
MNIIELLSLRGLDVTKKIKMLRHQDTRYDLQELYRRGQIETYQAIQKTEILKCDYLAAFIGLEGTRASFIGVWEVLGIGTFNDLSNTDSFLYPEMFDPDLIKYKIRKVSGFEDLEDRVIIDWGKSTRSWHQWLSEKNVTEVLAAGHIDSFPGYLDFSLTFDQLNLMIDKADANKTWHTMLKSVAGVYLILDTATGEQYVGSAYGKDGILGRWKNYAKNGHGNNKLLKSRLTKNKHSSSDLQFSILRTLPRSLTDREVIAYEVYYKNMLGTRAHGLNMN